jgi:hypothetical protein
MKVSLKLKLLLFLQTQIENIPEGQKAPKWLIYSCFMVTWFTNLSKNIRQFSRKVKYKFLSSLIVMYFSNLYFVFCTDKSEARIFSGWGYRWFAVRYADKRSDISRVNKLCGGKRHYAIEYDKKSLLVINRLEVNRLKQKNMLRKSYNVINVFENAYYVTK